MRCQNPSCPRALDQIARWQKHRGPGHGKAQAPPGRPQSRAGDRPQQRPRRWEGMGCGGSPTPRSAQWIPVSTRLGRNLRWVLNLDPRGAPAPLVPSAACVSLPARHAAALWTRRAPDSETCHLAPGWAEIRLLCSISGF